MTGCLNVQRFDRQEKLLVTLILWVKNFVGMNDRVFECTEV